MTEPGTDLSGSARVTIHSGSVEDILPTLDASSFDASFCDPPYGIGFMGKAWDHGVPGAPIWEEVARALKPGAHLLAFGGTRTFHRLTCGIEDAGFEVRDCLAWLYGQGFPKSHNLGGAFSGYGTALKPAWEPCVLAMKPTDGTFAANALRHGVAGLAIDSGRIAGDVRSVPQPNLKTARKAITGYDAVSRNGMMSSAPLGRWPANVLLDEDAARALDEQSGWSKTPNCVTRGSSTNPSSYGLSAQGVVACPGDSGGASRFFYTAKVGSSERQGSRHPTLKPLDLCAYMARLLLPPKRETPRRILVPFSGAGSEVIGCLRAGWDEVVGVEREEEYVADAKRRIESEFGMLADVRVIAPAEAVAS